MNKESIFALGFCMIFSIVMTIYASSLDDLAVVIMFGVISIIFTILFSSVALNDGLKGDGE